MQSDPFQRIKGKTMEIKVGEDLIKVKPTVKEMELFMLMKKDMSEEDSKRFTNILVRLIKNANPDKDEDAIIEWLGWNYVGMIQGLAPIFGVKMDLFNQTSVKKNLSIKE